MWSTKMGLLALLALAACSSSPTGPGEDLADQPTGTRIGGGTGIDAGFSRECGSTGSGATSRGASAVRRCLK